LHKTKNENFNSEVVMVFEICAIIAVFIFAVLVFYLIRTLQTFQCFLRHMNDLSLDLDQRIKQLDSTLNTISHVGDSCEEKIRQCQVQKLHQIESECAKNNVKEDISDLIIASLKLGINFLRR
ncbi:MAG: DUF948 domain-containing protein, partial [Parachlamydiaceae bacterium]